MSPTGVLPTEDGKRSGPAGLGELAGARQAATDQRRHRRHRFGGWDVLGIALTTLVMLGVHRAATAVIGTPLGHPHRVDRALAVIIAVLGAVSLALVVGLSVRERSRPATLVRRIRGIWTDPPGSWAAGVLGALLTIPLLGLYAPVLLYDADSARIVSAVSHVQEHGIDFILETQDNLVPHLVLGPAVALGGLAGAKLVTIATLQALAAVIAYVTHRITGSMLGALSAVLALVAMPAVVARGGFVPMYPTMLALGYLGGWLSYLAITQRHRRWWRAAGAGACLALAPEAQAVGLLFLVAPVLVLVFAPGWRDGLAGLVRIYVFVGLASIPRVAIDTAVGGFERMTSYRTDYWITKGYVRRIQSEFWNYPGIDEPLGDYLAQLPGRFFDTLEAEGQVVFALALLAWLLVCRGRGRMFVLAVVGAMVMAVTAKQVPPFPRYYSPLWPGIALVVGVGVAELARRRAVVPRALAVLVVPVLAALGASSLDTVVHQQDERRALIDDGPYHELAELVDDGKGVVGARSHALVNVTADIPTWGGQFLTEDEYATYLTWPSDDQVIEVMQRHDIGWVLVHPKRDLEIDYHNTWLIPSRGVPARHVEQLAASSRFCPVAEIDGFRLYRLGSCFR